jgi:hypothetical protein
MGQSLADAMTHAPDVFSPFAVSLVQQGEARNDIAGAFNKIADFLQKEGDTRHTPSHEDERHESGRETRYEVTIDSDERVAPEPAAPRVAPGSPLTVIALDGLIDRLHTLGLRALTIIAGLLLALATVWWLVELEILERRWLNVTLCSVAALFMGGAGVWVQRRIDSERKREARCSFCGVYSERGDGLERAPRFAGAAICPRCAAIVAKRYGETPDSSPEAQASEQNNAANPVTSPPVTEATSRSGETKPAAGPTKVQPNFAPPEEEYE